MEGRGGLWSEDQTNQINPNTRSGVRLIQFSILRTLSIVWQERFPAVISNKIKFYNKAYLVIKLAGRAFSELGDTTFKLFFLGSCSLSQAYKVGQISNLTAKLNKFSLSLVKIYQRSLHQTW